MHERSTNHQRSKENEKVYPAAESPDSQGEGANRKRGRGCPKVSDSCRHSVSMEEGPGAGCTDISKRQETQGRSTPQETGGGKPQVEGGPCPADPRTDALKKRDELGLSGRRKGCHYSQEQRQRIVWEVSRLCNEGIPKYKSLKELGVCRSTYYGWLKKDNPPKVLSSVLRLTHSEQQAIIEKKKAEPHMSHRQISGFLRDYGYWISPSSCYRSLKALGWVSPQQLHEAPWKTPHYEPFRPNQIWGEDWTILDINGLRHYLLTIIDYFSRYIVAWGIVKTVTQREVQNLLALAYLGEDIDQQGQKPILRTDQGSPNMARNTRRLIKDLEMILSPSRVYRPTDNSRQERWYRTVKQEEIYCYPTYPTVEIGRSSLAYYIDFYNEKRPHQALCNYTPGYVHRLGNKTELLNHYKKMVRIAKEQRIHMNRIEIPNKNYRAVKLTPFLS